MPGGTLAVPGFEVADRRGPARQHVDDRRSGSSPTARPSRSSPTSSIRRPTSRCPGARARAATRICSIHDAMHADHDYEHAPRLGPLAGARGRDRRRARGREEARAVPSQPRCDRRDDRRGRRAHRRAAPACPCSLPPRARTSTCSYPVDTVRRSIRTRRAARRRVAAKSHVDRSIVARGSLAICVLSLRSRPRCVRVCAPQLGPGAAHPTNVAARCAWRSPLRCRPRRPSATIAQHGQDHRRSRRRLHEDQGRRDARKRPG